MNTAAQVEDKADWTHLDKGAVLTQTECERHHGVPAFRYEYGLAQMKLAGEIEASLRRAGRPVKVVQRKLGLYVLTDDEVGGWANRSLSKARLAVNNAHNVALNADPSRMTDDAKREYERAIQRAAMYKQALSRVERERREKV